MELPGEVWIEIFTIAILSNFPLPVRVDRQKPAREMYHLLSVCRTWYALIMSTPLLWTKIEADETRVPQATVLRAGTHLPIELHLYDEHAEVPCDNLRVTSLFVHAGSSEGQSWIGLDDFSNLQTLVLSGIPGSCVFSTFPRLRVVHIIGKVALFSVGSGEWTNLLDLIVDSTATNHGPRTRMLRNIVANSPAMESLVVKAQRSHCDAKILAPLVLEKLQRIVVEMPSQGLPRHLLQQLSAPNFLPDSVSSAGYRMRSTLIVSTSTITVYRSDQALPCLHLGRYRTFSSSFLFTLSASMRFITHMRINVVTTTEMSKIRHRMQSMVEGMCAFEEVYLDAKCHVMMGMILGLRDASVHGSSIGDGGWCPMWRRLEIDVISLSPRECIRQMCEDALLELVSSRSSPLDISRLGWLTNV